MGACPKSNGLKQIIEGTQGVLEGSALDTPGDARRHLKRRMRQLRLLGQGSLLLDSCRPEPRRLRRYEKRRHYL